MLQTPEKPLLLKLTFSNKKHEVASRKGAANQLADRF